jgi:PAS domain S-box-containing protein
MNAKSMNMKTTTSRTKRWKENLPRAYNAVLERVLGVWAGAEPKQRRRLRLLSAFLIIMTLITLSGSLAVMAIGGYAWVALWGSIMGVATLLLINYLLVRTKFYSVAVLGSIVVPGITPLVIAIIKPVDINLATQLMWLALPLLIASLMLPIRKTIIVTICYLVFAVVLGIIGSVEFGTLAPIMAYMVTIAFFVITITAAREKDQSELVNEATRRRIFIEQSRDGIVILDMNGKVIEANQSFANMLGYTMEEACQLHIFDWDVNVPREQMLENLQNTDENGANVERQHQRKDGTSIDVDISINTAMFNGQRYLLTVSRDITERKRMEQALRESEEKFTKAFQSVPEAVSITDTEDTKYVVVNDSFLALTGYTREEVIGHSAQELDLWANADESSRMKRLIEQQGIFKNEEFILQTKSKETRNILVTADKIDFGGQTCWLVVRNDITERKKTENALRESEEKFSKAFHASPQQIIITRKRDNVTMDVNDSYTQVTGYSRAETVGKTAEELGVWMTPEDFKRFEQTLDSQGRISNEEFEFYNKSGGTHIELVSVEPITISGEDCWMSISTDITKRKQMENALRESEEKFSKAFQVIPETISISRINDRKFVDVNDSFCRSKGLTRAEIIGHSAKELNLVDDLGRLDETFELVKRGGNVINQELEFTLKSGEKQTFLFSADTATVNGELCMFVISNDITGRKRMERALKESEEKFSKAFHAIPEAISISRLDNGKFVDVNDSFIHGIGLTREEFIGRSSSELGLRDRAGRRQELIKMIKERGSVINQEVEHKSPKGEIRTLLFSADIINIGNEPCMLSISNDITDRKKSEKQIQEANIKLQQSSAQLLATNKELESFSYSVSHDLRSPLRSIDGFSQALLEDYEGKLDEKGQDYLNRIRNASQKMGDLIDGLLKLSRLTRSEMHQEKVDLGVLAKEIMDRLKEAQPTRRVKFTVGKDLGAEGDPQMIRALLENLLGNAWKFTAKTKVAAIELGQANNDSKKTFFIKDNGAGFDMAFKDKLFGAFQRLHDSAEFPGTGIGLATVQRIVNRHGGTIWAEGEINKGATFYFSLS